MRHQSGFTLIELVVTISVAAILMALAVPSFRSTIQNNRVTGQANEFITSLTMARSEAVKRGRNAYVCISSDGATCKGTNWAVGWLIWVSGNTAGTWDATETTLRVHEALPTGSTLTEAGGAASVQFNPDGSAGAAVTFTLSAAGCTGNQRRTISVSATGQPSVATLACP
ncbi:MAG: GspH/FimT family pseudopilin [Gammaproteobacteria bacterium]